MQTRLTKAEWANRMITRHLDWIDLMMFAGMEEIWSKTASKKRCSISRITECKDKTIIRSAIKSTDSLVSMIQRVTRYRDSKDYCYETLENHLTGVKLILAISYTLY